MKKFVMVAYTDYVSDARCKYEAEALASNGDLVDFISIKNSDIQEDFEVINGVNLYRIKNVRYFGGKSINYIFCYLTFFFKVFFKLSFLQIKKTYDCVHVNNIPDFMVFTALIPKLMGSKIILDFHDAMANTYMAKFDLIENNWIIRLIKFQTFLSAKFANIIITVHEPLKDIFVSYRISKYKIKIILNCASQKIFYYLPKTRTNNEFQLIYHGAIAERLGVDILAKAIKLLVPKIPEIKLVIYGGGEFLEGLAKLIKDLEIENYVDYHPGFIPYEKLPPIIAEADLGIVPTKKEKGNELMLPVKLLEYASMCKPIVCSKIYTVEKYFDEKMILYFEPENEVDLAEKIFYLYENPKQRKEFAENVKRFNQQYNGEKEKEKYRKIVYDLIEGKN